MPVIMRKINESIFKQEKLLKINRNLKKKVYAARK